MVFLKDIPHSKRHLPKIDFLKLVLLLAALATAFSVFYYLVIFLPEKERTRIELERELAATEAAKEASEEADRQFNQSMLEACLADAESDYNSNWDGECKSQGLSKDCRLPQYNADSIDDTRSERKDDCFKQYPASSR